VFHFYYYSYVRHFLYDLNILRHPIVAGGIILYLEFNMISFYLSF